MRLMRKWAHKSQLVRWGFQVRDWRDQRKWRDPRKEPKRQHCTLFNSIYMLFYLPIIHSQRRSAQGKLKKQESDIQREMKKLVAMACKNPVNYIPLFSWNLL